MIYNQIVVSYLSKQGYTIAAADDSHAPGAVSGGTGVDRDQSLAHQG